MIYYNGYGARRKDPVCTYDTKVEVQCEVAKKGYVYMKCNFFEKWIIRGVIRYVNVKRLKDRLAYTYVNVGKCANVPDEVK